MYFNDIPSNTMKLQPEASWREWLNLSSVLHRRADLRPNAAVFCLLLLVSLLASSADAQRRFQPGGLWRPPWENFDNTVVATTTYGEVRGFSVPMHVEDEAWNQRWDDQPLWYIQRINCWLGIPYAQPPVGNLRFRRPRHPTWPRPSTDTVAQWDATYFRHSCPQDIRHIRGDIPDYPQRNISEDCLHMNIFAPNITWHSRRTLYPVVVFIHGGEFVHGTAQIYPGQVLARQEVVVVTFNYRLGALGFLTTMDEHGPGNWGLWDQHLALEFVRDNIKSFRGDPNKITLMGDGAGASSVGHLIISPVTQVKTTRKYFHKAILMSGSDMAGSGFINPFWRPYEYALKLGKLLHCDTDDSFELLNCLRNNRTRPWQDILQAQNQIVPNDGEMGEVWGPVPDGGYYNWLPILPGVPTDLRRLHTFAKIPIIIGINQQDGVDKARRIVQGLGVGMSEVTMKNFLKRQLTAWRVMNRYWQRALEAVQFQYTYWPEPSNRTALAQEFINMVTDLDYGIGMDDVIKYHSTYESSYQYVWSYKSWEDYRPHWMGAAPRAQIPYVFGYPFMNETVLNETSLVMRQWYDYEDRNMSECTMLMWTNFIKYTIPTPNVTCNVTWEPFLENNLTYLILDYHKHMWFRYRQSNYGFWRNYYPMIAKQDYLRPTATPTPRGFEYVYATGSMGAVLCLSLLVLAVCIYLLVLQSRKDDGRAYSESEVPFSFSRSQSNITVSTRSRHSPVEYSAPYGSQYLHTSQSHSEI